MEHNMGEYRRETKEVVIPIAEFKRLMILAPLVLGLVAFGGKLWAANDQLQRKADRAEMKTVDDSLGRIIVHVAGRLDRVEGMRDDVSAILRLVCAGTSPVDRARSGVGCRP